jgi:TP901 family phage tail tape measure protein
MHRRMQASSVRSDFGGPLKGALDIASKLVIVGFGVARAFRFASGALSSAVHPVIEFQNAMAEVGVKGAFSVEQVNKLAEAAKQMGRTSVLTPVKVAEMQASLAASGYTPDQIITNMPTVQKFAQASGMDTHASADFLVDTVHTYGLDQNKVESMKRVGNLVVNAARMSTISEADVRASMKYAGALAKLIHQAPEQTAAMIATAGQYGIKGSQAGTGVRNMLGALVKPKGGKLTEGMLAELGLTPQMLSEGIGDVPKLLQTISSRMNATKGWGSGKALLQKNADGSLKDLADAKFQNQIAAQAAGDAKRLRFIMALFGQYGATTAAALIDAAGKSSDATHNMLQAAEKQITDAQGSLDNAAEKKGATLGAGIEKLTAKWETLKISLGEKLAPHLSKSLDKIGDQILKWESSANASKDLSRAIDGIGTAFEAMAKGLELATPMLRETVKLLGQAADLKSVLMPGEEQAKRNADAENIPVEGMAPGATVKNHNSIKPVPKLSKTEKWINELLHGEGHQDPTTGAWIVDGGKIDMRGPNGTMKSIPSVIEMKITTDNGTKAAISKIKGGDTDVRVNMSVQP